MTPVLCTICGSVTVHDIVTGANHCPKEGCGRTADFVIKALREKKAKQELARRK